MFGNFKQNTVIVLAFEAIFTLEKSATKSGNHTNDTDKFMVEELQFSLTDNFFSNIFVAVTLHLK